MSSDDLAKIIEGFEAGEKKENNAGNDAFCEAVTAIANQCENVFNSKDEAQAKNSAELVLLLETLISKPEMRVELISVLAGIFFNGSHGISQDFVLSRKLYEMISNLGDLKATTHVAWHYENGLGVPVDMHEAYNWYKKAANLGYAHAQYCLGVFYMNGTGVEKNDEQAKDWYKKAAAQGHEDAKNNLKAVYGITSNSGGCYIATAVYGSYEAPQVLTLRRYRDQTLQKTWFGRLFIRVYYALSPALARRLRNAKALSTWVRKRLDFIVAKLDLQRTLPK